jgi:hypothetical protein
MAAPWRGGQSCPMSLSFAGSAICISGRADPWSAADPPVGFRGTCEHSSLGQERDVGVPGGPGGPPYLTKLSPQAPFRRPNRRTFLQLAGGLWLLPFGASACEARELIRGGSLGRVVFCRASQSTTGWMQYLLDGERPVCEPIDRDELILCGTEATLVIDRTGYRRFA